MMKKHLFVLFAVVFAICACSTEKEEVTEVISTNKYAEITGTFSINDFENAKAFILNNGDRKIYRAMDGLHPHYSFNGFESYLNAEISGLRTNPDNDPSISDFNQITLRDMKANPQYYTIQIVRKGDSQKSDINISEGMKEEKVYLLNPYDDDIEVMKINLKAYIDTIKSNF